VFVIDFIVVDRQDLEYWLYKKVQLVVARHFGRNYFVLAFPVSVLSFGKASILLLSIWISSNDRALNSFSMGVRAFLVICGQKSEKRKQNLI